MDTNDKEYFALAVVDHTSAYLAFNIFFLHVSEYTDVNQVAFEFPTYTQLRCPASGIPWDPRFTDVSHTNPVSKLRIISLVFA